MQFNIRQGNYANAGKAAADDTVRAFAAARRNSPDYGKMAQQAQAIRSKVKREGIKAATAVTKTGIQAAGEFEALKIKETATRKRDSARRKAGALATAGKLFGTAGSYLGEKRTKREIGGEDSFYDTMISRNNDKLTELQAELDALKPPGSSSSGSGGSASTPGGSTNTPSQSSGGSTSENSSTISPTSQLTEVQTRGLKAIREVESGQYGYDAYNLGGRTEFDPIGSGSATDGRFGKPLTQMTIGEIKALGNSGKIHATGAYQFTHNTGSFGEAASFAGLSDNDLFTPANQDAMALAFGQKYGWERWSGLKKDSGRAQLAQQAFQ